MKTKLGVSVSLLAAAMYFMGLFSGYLVLALLSGYVLLFESDEWLKKSAVKAFAICVFFSVISAFIGFIPDAIGLIDNVLNIFDDVFTIEVASQIVNLANSVIGVAQKIILLLAGFKALKHESFKFDKIDKLVDEHMK